MKKVVLFFLFLLSFLFEKSMAQDSSLQELIKSYELFQKEEFSNPANAFLPVAEKDQKRRNLFFKNLLAKLHQIDKKSLDAQSLINLELLVFLLEDKIEQYAFKNYLVPLNAEGGWYTDFIVRNDRKRFSNLDDYYAYIQEMESFYQHANANMELMKEGIAIGRMAPAAILKGRENIVKSQLVNDPALSPFYKHFNELPDYINQKQKKALQDKAKEAIDNSILPAYRQFHEFWTQEYLPNAPAEIGIISQYKGAELYQQRVRFFTTLQMTPKEVYETGKKEVARIRKEMESIIQEVGFEGSFADFLTFLRTDEQFYAKTPEEILKEASYIAKKIDGLLPKYFDKLPRNSYGVQPVPAAIAPTYTSGRYSPGSLKNHQAGNYWVNTTKLSARPLYALPSLTLHEAVPGHHLQISLAQEMENMPNFRKQTYLSAFGEGWALYTEWLGEEMGIYTTPYERFGKLTYEMWRACRLVVDPGMHVFGMSRQEAIDFMASNTALSIHECTTEIDRYIGWPGQAVSYKIGELKIRELRKKAQKELGDDFNLRAFHDLILSNGAVPLFVLDRMVQEWIETFKAD